MADVRARASNIIFAWLLPGSAWMDYWLRVTSAVPIAQFFYDLDAVYFSFTRESMLAAQTAFNGVRWLAGHWFLAKFFLYFDQLKEA